MRPLAITLEAPGAATEAEALGYLGRFFPEAGDYVLKAPTRTMQVRFSAPPARAADALTLWQTLFPVAGEYRVAPAALLPAAFLKALDYRERGGAGFEEWFLEQLLVEAREQFTSVRELVLRAVTRFLEAHGGDLAEPGVLAKLEELLFDLRQGVRWSVAMPVPAHIEETLRELGFSQRDVLDFPGIAFRLGIMDVELRAPGATFTWPEVLAIAARAPLLHSDQVAITYARQRAGQYLTPVVLRDGQTLSLAAAAREHDMLRTMTQQAVREEMHPRAFARELYKTFDKDGLYRDWDRVARTEILEARNRGAFEGERRVRQWTAETQVYRAVEANPCNGCLTLYKRPDGTPRLYTVREVEAEDAKGPNRGPWREWHARIGTTHPNCRCSPWQTHVPALAVFFEREAGKWRQVFERRGLVEKAEAA